MSLGLWNISFHNPLSVIAFFLLTEQFFCSFACLSHIKQPTAAYQTLTIRSNIWLIDWLINNNNNTIDYKSGCAACRRLGLLSSYSLPQESAAITTAGTGNLHFIFLCLCKLPYATPLIPTLFWKSSQELCNNFWKALFSNSVRFHCKVHSEWLVVGVFQHTPFWF